MSESCPLPARPASRPAPATIFASKGITRHLLRGALGAGALVWAVRLLPLHPFASLALAVLALLAFRGCPMCWTIGLVETVHRRFSARAHHTDKH